jgi:hypothetical protein
LELRYDNLLKDYDSARSQLRLDIDLANSGPFRIVDEIKHKLSQANGCIMAYYENLAKLETTTDLQQNLVNQFQEEKAVSLRQRLCLMIELSQMKEKLAQSKGKLRTHRRKIDTMRGLARIMAENALGNRKCFIKSLDQVEMTFFTALERFDSAAFLIQRAWRRFKNPKLEKQIISRTMDFPLIEPMAISIIDVIIGKQPPIAYRQILQMLNSYNDNMKDAVKAPLDIMRKNLAQMHEHSIRS